MVFGFNTFTNKVTNYNWHCIIICLPFSSFATFEMWWILSSPFFLIQSLSPCMCVKLLMAFAIVKEPMDNYLFFLSSFLLGFPCTWSNLHALVLELSKLRNWVVPTLIVIPKHRSLFLKATKHLKCLDILFIINIHNLNFRIHHMHTLIYGIMYAIYFGNTKKNVVKTFKPIKWRCIRYFNLLLFCFIDLLYFVPLLSNLLPILLHII
jgi:hypothetical protein